MKIVFCDASNRFSKEKKTLEEKFELKQIWENQRDSKTHLSLRSNIAIESTEYVISSNGFGQ
jgi:hypothetical protein